MTDARVLTRALADPQSVLAFDAADWTALLTIAKAERLAGSLAYRLDGLALPLEVQRVLAGARANAEAGRTHALWEAEMAWRALAPLAVPVVLLKGSAFVAAGLDAGRGRLIGDLDILVQRHDLAAVESALLAAGWEWVKPDPYDDAYYRRWMHELPPLIHRERDRMIDVHHTILPLTARPIPDAGALLSARVALNDGFSMLAPEDMIVHAAAHLLADGDLAGGLRNLWDIDRLVREFDDDGFHERLQTRAMLHGLDRETRRALRLSAALFDTPIPQSDVRFGDRFYRARLTARDGWGGETRPWLRLMFYVRSHWLRMPPLMLARHLWVKWRR
ncbi:nucleotidyltransferase family protein [Sphingomonas sp.]|uniref:nucleotidyltransferase domain-containing protein n=1 Tax=Sphingomonas sp. TaxID=28214 RepID=UPI0025E289B0|nr:nucleotidyltransferase family protein [Sphingomonas sp.]